MNTYQVSERRQLTVPFFDVSTKKKRYSDWNLLLAYTYRKLRSKDVNTENIKAEIISTNFGLIKRVASAFQSHRQPLDDLVQVGVECILVHIIDRYDPSLGYAFSTFAIPHLRGAMKRHLQKTANAIYIPAQIQRNYRAIKSAREAVYEKTGDELINVEKISEMVKLPQEKVKLTLRAYAQQPTSLDKQVFPTLSRSFSDFIPDPGTVSSDYDEDLYRLSVVKDVLAKLEPQTQKVIMLYYVSDYTQKEISIELDLKISTVRTILTKGLRTLRRMCPAIMKADSNFGKSSSSSISTPSSMPLGACLKAEAERGSLVSG